MTYSKLSHSGLDQAAQIAAEAFGLSELKSSQKKALEAWADGKNLLVVWPTGHGKSLCYQLPALLGEGLVLVVSPLVALMADQVLKAQKLNLPFTFINSSLSREQREQRQADLKAGRYRLVYVTPERFRKEEFWQALEGVKVSLLAVDEAHCISQWGHDFRPDYSRLGEIRRRLGSPQTMALTATATVQVQKDIVQQLQIETPELLLEGVERPNLFLGVVDIYGEEAKNEWLEEFLTRETGNVIVYFSLITTLVKASQFLQSKKIRHVVYHGDLPPSVRAQNQKEFVNGRARLILATPAFGLGVDKPDVRGLVHYEIPGSVEAYYQEVGRAGRDGNPSECWLLYDQEDLEKQMEFIEWATPEPAYLRALFDFLRKNEDKLGSMDLDHIRGQLSFKNKRDYRLETALAALDRWNVIEWPNRDLTKLRVVGELEATIFNETAWRERRKHLQMNLFSLVEWVKTEGCRKVLLYKYFGWPNEKNCGQCDVCRSAGG